MGKLCPTILKRKTHAMKMQVANAMERTAMESKSTHHYNVFKNYKIRPLAPFFSKMESPTSSISFTIV